MKISANSNIRQAIKILNKYGTQTILVINHNNKLVGTLSDGDIRKSIIKGFDLKSSINSIYNKKPIFIYENEINKKKIRKYKKKTKKKKKKIKNTKKTYKKPTKKKKKKR